MIKNKNRGGFIDRQPQGIRVGEEVENLIGRLDSENVEFYLMGDMNCNMASMSLTHSPLLLDITDLYGLHQLINDPTRH